MLHTALLLNESHFLWFQVLKGTWGVQSTSSSQGPTGRTCSSRSLTTWPWSRKEKNWRPERRPLPEPRGQEVELRAKGQVQVRVLIRVTKTGGQGQLGAFTRTRGHATLFITPHRWPVISTNQIRAGGHGKHELLFVFSRRFFEKRVDCSHGFSSVFFFDTPGMTKIVLPKFFLVTYNSARD